MRRELNRGNITSCMLQFRQLTLFRHLVKSVDERLVCVFFIVELETSRGLYSRTLFLFLVCHCTGPKRNKLDQGNEDKIRVLIYKYLRPLRTNRRGEYDVISHVVVYETIHFYSISYKKIR